MKTVFTLHDGHYDEHRLVGVFSTREDAEAWATKYNEGPVVSEVLLDGGNAERAQGLSLYTVKMLYDGSIAHCVRERGVQLVLGIPQLRVGVSHDHDCGCVLGEVWARSAEDAIDTVRVRLQLEIDAGTIESREQRQAEREAAERERRARMDDDDRFDEEILRHVTPGKTEVMADVISTVKQDTGRVRL